VGKAEIVKDWKPELKALGFVYRDHMFQVQDRLEQSLQFAIALQRNLHSDTYLIHFEILIGNPFSSELRPEVLIHGHLRPEGVYLHVHKSSWWPRKDMSDALAHVKQHAMSWFRKWSDASFLVEKHEIAIRNRQNLVEVFEPLTAEQEDSLHKILHRPIRDEARVSPAVLRHAAVLHFLNGNREMAIQRTKDWLAQIDPDKTMERAQAEFQLKRLEQAN
jgi:hypothetical protein